MQILSKLYFNQPSSNPPLIKSQPSSQIEYKFRRCEYSVFNYLSISIFFLGAGRFGPWWKYHKIKFLHRRIISIADESGVFWIFPFPRVSGPAVFFNWITFIRMLLSNRRGGGRRVGNRGAPLGGVALQRVIQDGLEVEKGFTPSFCTLNKVLVVIWRV